MALTPYLVHLGILIGIYAILVLSMNITIGFTGLLNLGHIAFFGIGAYTTALVVLKLGWPLWAGFVAAAVFAAFFGALLAIPTSKLKGDYLALATVGFAFIITAVARNWIDLTRGALGIPGIPKLVSSNTTMLLVLVIAVVIITAFFAWLVQSRWGKVFQAVRDDEIAAKVLGHNAFGHKIASMAIAAFFAGIAGAFYAHYITFIDPSIFALTDIILILSMLIVGGLASNKGAIVGTALLLLLPEPLRFIGMPSSVIGPVRVIMFSLLLLLIIIWRPRGIFGRVDLA